MHSVANSLLIVPCGIETTYLNCERILRSRLLIVPCGIETERYTHGALCHFLLIVPCGIETKVYSVEAT